jgi:SAM-dependent methyltransferase
MTSRDYASAIRPLPGNEDDVNRDFDRVYPDWVRCQSERHWTPVEVATRAANLLVTSACTRVLDVGSGAGKFCITSALTTQHRHFHGVEQRADLVEVAREAARQYGVERRVHFVHGNIMSIDWREFNAFYFYNPFSEPIDAPLNAVEGTIELGAHLRKRYIHFTIAQLAAAPVGTRVVTFYGFGGSFPPSYRCVRREVRGTDFLELWIKQPTALWLPPSDSEADERERRRTDAAGARSS